MFQYNNIYFVVVRILESRNVQSKRFYYLGKGKLIVKRHTSIIYIFASIQIIAYCPTNLHIVMVYCYFLSSNWCFSLENTEIRTFQSCLWYAKGISECQMIDFLAFWYNCLKMPHLEIRFLRYFSNCIKRIFVSIYI